MNIKDIYSKALSWGTSVLSEKDGTGSTSRIAFLILVVTSCGALVSHIIFNHALPTREQLEGLALVSSAGASGYGVNRLSHKNDTSLQDTHKADDPDAK